MRTIGKCADPKCAAFITHRWEQAGPLYLQAMDALYPVSTSTIDSMHAKLDGPEKRLSSPHAHLPYCSFLVHASMCVRTHYLEKPSEWVLEGDSCVAVCRSAQRLCS